MLVTKIYLVTEFQDHNQADELTKCGAKHRLISYVKCGNLRRRFIKDYVKQGHGRDPWIAESEKMSVVELFRHLKAEIERGDDE